MRDIVVVPCYDRPEYTRLCLQYLAQARGIKDKEIWMFLDNHEGTDFRKIFDLVDSRKILLKCMHYGFDNNVLKRLSSINVPSIFGN